jgi:hypothetical protein
MQERELSQRERVEEGGEGGSERGGGERGGRKREGLLKHALHLTEGVTCSEHIHLRQMPGGFDRDHHGKV